MKNILEYCSTSLESIFFLWICVWSDENIKSSRQLPGNGFPEKKSWVNFHLSFHSQSWFIFIFHFTHRAQEALLKIKEKERQNKDKGEEVKLRVDEYLKLLEYQQKAFSKEKKVQNKSIYFICYYCYYFWIFKRIWDETNLE